MFLSATRASLLKTAKVSRYAAVELTPYKTFDCAWQIVCLDPSYRLELQNSPIDVGIPFLLTHSATNSHLGSATKHIVR